MSSKFNVAIIITSTRTPRIGPDVAKLVKQIIENDGSSGFQLTLVDLALFNLPVYDEPVVPFQVPAQASFSHEHSRRWSDEISKYDAYIFVIPEYNYGMSGGTKNAIDYLKNEWISKPAVIISYGITGGKIDSEQVKVVLEGMELNVCSTRPQLIFRKSAGTPDVFTAMSQGQLGEQSHEDWANEPSNILKAFGELKEALKNKPETEKEP
ncbi:flavoprotein-like protein [Xylogone sp. PMI_703]|nr:flavoprotein-like protein [Xylogone sp. PMI_703]